MSLTILLAAEDAPRARAALSLALAQAALGGRVRLYAHERAVAALVAVPRADDDSVVLAESGLPDRCAMLDMAVESGVTLIACQTGLAMAGLTIGDLAPGVEAGGLVGLLATMGDDRLVTF